jgi:hypothetical protein
VNGVTDIERLEVERTWALNGKSVPLRKKGKKEGLKNDDLRIGIREREGRWRRKTSKVSRTFNGRGV